MQPKSQDKEPDNTTQKPSRSQVMNDLAKGALVVLCLAGAYKILTTDVGVDTPAVTQAQPIAQVQPATPPAAAPDKAAPGQIDEARLGQLIKERQAVVAAQGKVMIATSKPAATGNAGPSPVPPAPVAAPAVPGVPMAARTAPPGYIAKVGFNNDGTPMPEAQKLSLIHI